MGWLAFVSTLTSAGAAFWIAFGERRATKASKRVALVIFVSSLVSAVLAWKGEVDRGRFETSSLTKSDEAIRQITGGGGVADVALSNLKPGQREAWLAISNESDYPLYDVHLAVADLVSLDSMQAGGASLKDAFLATTRSLGPFTLGPHQTQLLTDWKVPEGEAIGYGITATARNGAWFQALRYRMVDGEWRRASRIQRGEQILQEKVDDEFPRLKSGDPAW